MQAIYPWRRVFKALFAHDHFQGQEHAAPEDDSTGQLRAATKLGIRLHECGCGWHEWHTSLSALLDVLEDEMPVLPRSSRSYTGVSCLACWLSCCFCKSPRGSLLLSLATVKRSAALSLLCITLNILIGWLPFLVP